MSRTIQAVDFNKPYQYEQALKRERKNSKNFRQASKNKQSIWEPKFENE